MTQPVQRARVLARARRCSKDVVMTSRSRGAHYKKRKHAVIHKTESIDRH